MRPEVTRVGVIALFEFAQQTVAAAHPLRRFADDAVEVLGFAFHIPFGFRQVFDRMAFVHVPPHVFDGVAQTKIVEFGQIDALEWSALVMPRMVHIVDHAACPFVSNICLDLEVVAVSPFADDDEQQNGSERDEHVPHEPPPVLVAHRSSIIVVMVAFVLAIAMSWPAR